VTLGIRHLATEVAIAQLHAHGATHRTLAIVVGADALLDLVVDQGRHVHLWQDILAKGAFAPDVESGASERLEAFQKAPVNSFDQRAHHVDGAQVEYSQVPYA